MMTSTPVTQQQQTDGRTVREVVEFNQELVNEVWCRRIFRQILQSLELQYAMGMPHRPISPDTVLVLDSGDPMLLPSADIGAAWSEAGDLHDLAAVVHYAITKEFPPAAPLQGRPADTLGEYSDTFVTAVDRCLSPDPQQRPHNIEQLRNLLGIVPLGPAVPAMTGHVTQTGPTRLPEPAPSFLQEAAPDAEPGRMKRWLMVAGVATVLACGLGALLALLHGADSRDAVTLALPVDEPAAQGAQHSAAALPADTVSTPSAAPLPAADGLAADGQGSYAQAQAGAVADTGPVAGAGLAQGTPPQGAAATGASYKLVIKPWGMIQVDGVDRGVSPPLKLLNLPPGEHTIRIVNPNFPEHTVTVNAVKGGSAVIELDFSEEETP